MINWVFLIVGVVFAALSFGYARRSGWRAMRERFGPALGSKPRMKWVSHAGVGGEFYRNLLFIGFDDSGIHLSTLFPFRLSHPPLMIPWNEVGAPETVDPFKGRAFMMDRGGMWMTHMIFPIGHPVLTTLSLPVVFVKGTPLDPSLRP